MTIFIIIIALASYALYYIEPFWGFTLFMALLLFLAIRQVIKEN